METFNYLFPQIRSDAVKKTVKKNQVVYTHKVSQTAKDLAPVIADLKQKGITSLKKIVRALNEQGFQTQRQKRWHAVQVKRVLEHIHQYSSYSL